MRHNAEGRLLLEQDEVIRVEPITEGHLDRATDIFTDNNEKSMTVTGWQGKVFPHYAIQRVYRTCDTGSIQLQITKCSDAASAGCQILELKELGAYTL